MVGCSPPSIVLGRHVPQKWSKISINLYLEMLLHQLISRCHKSDEAVRLPVSFPNSAASRSFPFRTNSGRWQLKPGLWFWIQIQTRAWAFKTSVTTSKTLRAAFRSSQSDRIKTQYLKTPAAKRVKRKQSVFCFTIKISSSLYGLLDAERRQ